MTSRQGASYNLHGREKLTIVIHAGLRNTLFYAVEEYAVEENAVEEYAEEEYATSVE